MAQTLYALLVGIDSYPLPIRSLHGCANDIEGMAALLRERGTREGTQIQLRTLLNESATREAVIDAFRNHLGRAQQDEVALFCYCGHGSQQATAPEFWYLEPDRLDETLVCYDSRQPGQHDLADKELSKLIAEVAQRDAHVLIILDSCHSGSGTRAGDSPGVRRAPPDSRIREASSYLVTATELEPLSRGHRATAASSGWVKLPRGKHVVMSACQSDEESQEIRQDGTARGVFSYFLQQSLQRTTATPTYRDLFKRVDALVRTRVSRQSPVIEATDLSDLDRPFAGGALVPSAPYFTVTFDRQNAWVIDGGAMHGIERPVGTETTWLAVFAAEATSFKDSSAAIGEARVLKTLPGQSVIELTLSNGAAPDRALTYKAIVIAQPLTPIDILLEGESVPADLLRQALATAGSGTKPSLLVHESTDSPRLRVTATAQGFRIRRIADERPLVVDVTGASAESARLVVGRLEHIARWMNISALANRNSQLSKDAIRMEIFTVGEGGEQTALADAASGTGLRLEYTFRDGKWHAPKFRVRLTNTSQRKLYCMLLDLTQTYKVWPGMLPGAGVWLEKGQVAWALQEQGGTIYAQVPDALWDQGLLQIVDIMKLLVTTEYCDATLLELPELDTTLERRGDATRRVVPLNTFERLMQRVQTRDLSGPPSGQPVDWIASEVAITTVRPRALAPLAAEGGRVELTPQITVLGHPALKASMRLSSLPLASRDAEWPALPECLRDELGFSQPFELSQSRDANAGLCVIELSDINDVSVVTPEQPLRLRIELPLADSEHILPLGVEGEFWMPLGCARHEDGAIQISLERLPKSIDTRSLKSAVRILFQKLVAPRLGFQYTYPHLAVVERSGQRITDPDTVQARIATASRIVLYVHGIIGDTLGMAGSAYTPLPAVQPPVPLLSESYDLVLAFDYENVNTPIEQTARDLKQRLARVGLGPDHPKTLHMVAHSMGGLVSRWLIEREGGARLVHKLIMLGTPNGGSPWPVVQNWASTAVTLALNGLTPVAWPAKVLGGLVALIERVDVALDQMEPGSAFLKSLAASDAPEVPYVILAGNTSLIASENIKAISSRRERLLTMLSGHWLLHRATALAFFDAPNDIAVSVHSIGAMPEAWSAYVPVKQIPTDHISYFSSEPGLRALAAELTSR